MQKSCILFAFVLLALALPGCHTKETPPEVLQQYNELTDNLDKENAGQAIEKIEAFVRENPYSDIEKFAKWDKKELIKKLRSRYQSARDLARDGNFTEAETILKDLVKHAPGTDEGKEAAKYLQFDFYFFQIQQLMMDHKFGEARKIATELRKQDLSSGQSHQLEMVLDNLAVGGKAERNNLKARAMSACQELRITLIMHYQEMGKYPASLNLTNLREIGYGGGALQNSLSAIENYQTSRGDFSFIAISKDESFRFRVTSDGMEEVHEK